jgi:acid phosphatase
MLLFVLACLVFPSQAQKWENFFLIMFENHGYTQVTGNAKWQQIMNGTFQLTNYHAVTHPSQPNYVAQLGGSYFTCTDDSPCNLSNKNLVDLLEAKSLTWKGYMENYTQAAGGACNLSTSFNSYYRKHNPFMSFTDITSDVKRCNNILPETAFFSDVKTKLPNFGYYTPNINNDSHDQNLDYSGDYFLNWLATYYTPYAKTTWANTLFMITFDEDEGAEGNHVVAFFKNVALSNATDNGQYTHYSITAFVENNFGLGNLGQNDAKAADFGPVLH